MEAIKGKLPTAGNVTKLSAIWRRPTVDGSLPRRWRM